MEPPATVGVLFCDQFHSLPCFFHTDSLWLWGEFSSPSSVSMWCQQNKQPQWQKAGSVRVCRHWGQRWVVGC